MTKITEEMKADLANLRRIFGEWEREMGEPIDVIEAVGRLLKHSNSAIYLAMSTAAPEKEIVGRLERLVLAGDNLIQGAWRSVVPPASGIIVQPPAWTDFKRALEAARKQA